MQDYVLNQSGGLADDAPTSACGPMIGRRWESEDITVTVCVAAICAGNILLGASDRMLTASDVQFEPETPKIYEPTNSSVIMIAGDSSLQTEILLKLFQFAAERIRANSQEWLPIAALANEYYNTYQAIKSQRAEARVYGHSG
jgi:20S proteasome alpha/beta subunit